MLARACGFDSRLAHHKKGHDVSRVLFCGLRGPKARSALRDFNAQGGSAAPAPRFCLGQNARTAHPRRRPEGRLGGSLPRVRIIAHISNIHFDRPFRKKGHDVSRCGLCGPKARSALRDFNARGGRAAPAPRFCLGQNARTAHPRRRPEGPLGGFPATVLFIQNIHFNHLFYKKGHDLCRVLFGGRGPLSVRTWPSGPGYPPGAGRRRRAGRGRPVP